MYIHIIINFNYFFNYLIEKHIFYIPLHKFKYYLFIFILITKLAFRKILYPIIYFLKLYSNLLDELLILLYINKNK